MNITIRPINLNDTGNIVKWRNQPFVQSRFLYREPFTVQAHTRWMENFVATKKVYQFIIVCEGVDIGSVYLRDVDLQSKKAEFGIFIGEDNYLGKGIGKKAVALILSFAFEQLGLHKVFLRVLSDNEAAIHSYIKSGFVQEGYFKDEIYIDNGYKSIIFMARFNPEEV